MRFASRSRSSHYEVLGHLASGGMGEILLARRVGPEGFEKRVVLKRPLAQTRGSPDIVRGLIEEARLLARINHPNVCHVHGLEEADGDLFLELEYLEGLSLWDVLSVVDGANEIIAPPILCALFEQACDGLDAIHSLRTRDDRPANVVHRDVSPGNLFVTVAGLLKVLDLGIAKSTESEPLTPYGRVKGKWPYLSPEQASGVPVDARADLFSLGMVMYDVTLGQRPSPERIGAIAAASLDFTGVPTELGRVITRAVAPARERFASAVEMRAALREAAVKLGGAADRTTIASWLTSRFGDALAQGRAHELAHGVHTGARTQTLAIGAVPPDEWFDVAAEAETSSAARVTTQTERLDIAARRSLVAIASRDSLPASSAAEGRRGSIASRDSLPASSAEGRQPAVEPFVPDSDPHSARTSAAQRPWWAIVATAGVIALGVLGIAFALGDRSAGGAACADDSTIARAWSTDRRTRMRARGAPPAATRALDEQVRAWQAMQREECEATAVRTPQTADLPARRIACLERRRRELVALLDHLDVAPPEALAAVPRVLADHDLLWTCRDAAGLAAEPAAAPAVIDDDVARLRVRIAAGDDPSALETAARALRYPPILAEALVYRGRTLATAGGTTDAATVFEDAIRAALAGNAIVPRVAALVELERLARARGDDADAALWASLASVAARRLRAPHPLAAPTDAATITAVCAPSDLRLHLPLDGDARDRSSYRSDGVVRGDDATTWVDGTVGGAIDLDGYNDAIDVGAPPSLADLPMLSVCAWILPRSYPEQDPVIVDKSADNYQGGWNLWIQTDGSFGLLTNYRDYVEGGLVRLGVWQHVCATWDGSVGSAGVALYFDGSPVAPSDTGDNRDDDDVPPARDADAARPLHIGCAGNGHFHFDGLIDDVRIYARVLGWKEIMALVDCARG